MRLTNKTQNIVDLLCDIQLPQLRAAVFGGMEGTGGSSAFGSKPPIDTAAADLLEEISDQAAQALAALSSKPTPYGHAEDYVREFGKLATEHTNVEIKVRATVAEHRQDRRTEAGVYLPNVYRERRTFSAPTLIAEWSERVEMFFNPPSIREIPLPCPACGIRYIERVKDGQTIRSNALNIHRNPETMQAIAAKCSNCRASWSPAQFPFLAKLMGLELAEDLEALAVPEHTIEIIDGVATFQCTAPADAPCHWWPDCECEWWPDEEKHDRRHPKVVHETCAMAEWLSPLIIADCWSHPDELPMPRNHARAGFEIEWQEMPLWWFDDVEPEPVEEA